jgi:hypothetical protein
METKKKKLTTKKKLSNTNFLRVFDICQKQLQNGIKLGNELKRKLNVSEFMMMMAILGKGILWTVILSVIVNLLHLVDIHEYKHTLLMIFTVCEILSIVTFMYFWKYMTENQSLLRPYVFGIQNPKHKGPVKYFSEKSITGRTLNRVPAIVKMFIYIKKLEVNLANVEATKMDILCITHMLVLVSVKKNYIKAKCKKKNPSEAEKRLNEGIDKFNADFDASFKFVMANIEKIFDKDFADIYMDAIKEAKAYDDVAELTRITKSTFNGAAVAQMHHTMLETQLGYLGIIDTDKVQKTLERVEAIGKEIGEL